MSITRAELLVAARTARVLGYKLKLIQHGTAFAANEYMDLTCTSPTDVLVVRWTGEPDKIKTLMQDETRTLGCWQVRSHMRLFYHMYAPTWTWPYWYYMYPRTRLDGCRVVIERKGKV